MTGLVHVTAVRTTELARTINGLSRHDPGVLVVGVPPERQVRMRELAKGVLMALGKRLDLPSASGFNAALDSDMQAWVGVSGITDLIVTEAERLPLPVACELSVLMEALGVRIWLVEYEPVRRRLGRLFELTSATEVDLSDFEAHWFSSLPAPSAAAVAPEPLKVFPRVPCAHGVVFRAECRRLLRSADFATVDQLYRSVFRQTESVLESSTRRQHPQRLAALFRSEFRRIPDPDALVTTARAMQAAGMLARWNVLVDELRVRSAAVLEPRDATRPPSEWAKLSAFRRTDLPAACALLASDLTPDQVAMTTLGAVAEGAAAVAVTGEEGEQVAVAVPEEGRVYVRAHVLRLRLGGAGDGEQLFLNFGSSHKSARERCNGLARKAAAQAGFQVKRPLEGRSESDHVVKQVAGLGMTFKAFDRKREKEDDSE